MTLWSTKIEGKYLIYKSNRYDRKNVEWNFEKDLKGDWCNNEGDSSKDLSGESTVSRDLTLNPCHETTAFKCRVRDLSATDFYSRPFDSRKRHGVKGVDASPIVLRNQPRRPLSTDEISQWWRKEGVGCEQGECRRTRNESLRAPWRRQKVHRSLWVLQTVDSNHFWFRSRLLPVTDRLYIVSNKLTFSLLTWFHRLGVWDNNVVQKLSVTE